jgi:uncharacterized protein (DUF2141 family)
MHQPDEQRDIIDAFVLQRELGWDHAAVLRNSFCLTSPYAKEQGVYAAFAFHDGNGNGKVDANLVGVPTEGFGFSNDIRPQVLPIPRSPTWKAVSFVVQPGDNSIRIRVRD